MATVVSNIPCSGTPSQHPTNYLYLKPIQSIDPLTLPSSYILFTFIVIKCTNHLRIMFTHATTPQSTLFDFTSKASLQYILSLLLHAILSHQMHSYTLIWLISTACIYDFCTTFYISDSYNKVGRIIPFFTSILILFPLITPMHL